MRDPGWLEYASTDLFQASIYPIPPHSDQKLENTYTQVVRAESAQSPIVHWVQDDNQSNFCLINY